MLRPCKYSNFGRYVTVHVTGRVYYRLVINSSKRSYSVSSDSRFSRQVEDGDYSIHQNPYSESQRTGAKEDDVWPVLLDTRVGFLKGRVNCSSTSKCLFKVKPQVPSGLVFWSIKVREKIKFVVIQTPFYQGLHNLIKKNRWKIVRGLNKFNSSFNSVGSRLYVSQNLTTEI